MVGTAGMIKGQAKADLTHGFRRSFTSRFAATEHFRSAYEQNTQQSPGLGFSMIPQARHSYKKTHRSVGIVSLAVCPQAGQVIVATSVFILNLFYQCS
jgi:hypothetical protein